MLEDYISLEEQEKLEFFFKYIFPVKIENYYINTYKKTVRVELIDIKTFYDDVLKQVDCRCNYTANNKPFSTCLYNFSRTYQFKVFKDENLIDIFINPEYRTFSEFVDNHNEIDHFLDIKFGRWFNTYVLQEEIADIKLKHFRPDTLYKIFRGSTYCGDYLGVYYINSEFKITIIDENDKLGMIYFENPDDILNILQATGEKLTLYLHDNKYKGRREGPDEYYEHIYEIRKSRVGKKELAQFTFHGYKLYIDATVLSNYICENPDLIKKYKVAIEK